MINKENLNREQIIREVTPIGNGAHIFALKEWIGEEVIVIRNPEPSLKKKVLKVIEPYLESIIGVYVYGSYARSEQRKDSDIDLLVISNKNIKIKEKGFEITVLEMNKIRDAIKIAPVLIYSSIIEAKPIINSELLGELKKSYKPEARNFKEYLVETREIAEINEELLDPYSIVLRLRGIYLIEKLLLRDNYSNENFKEWILKNARDLKKKIDFDYVYGAYLKIKDGLKPRIEEEDLRVLLLILKINIQKLEEKIHG